jgi:chromosome segregation ATPase
MLNDAGLPPSHSDPAIGALLVLLANPKDVKKRLETLIEREKAIEAQQKKLNETAANIEKDRKAAELARSEAADMRNNLETALTQRSQNLERLAKEHEKRDADLTAREADLAARKKDFASQSTKERKELDSLQQEIEAHHKAAARAKDKHEALSSLWEAKMEKLNKALTEA